MKKITIKYPTITLGPEYPKIGDTMRLGDGSVVTLDTPRKLERYRSGRMQKAAWRRYDARQRRLLRTMIGVMKIRPGATPQKAEVVTGKKSP